MVGDGNVFDKPALVTTVLGSCVAVTFYCRAKQVGAIFHAIMPVMPDKETNKQTKNYYKYVDTSVRHIVYSLQRRGIKQNQIEAKVFGGAQAFFKGKIRPGPNNIRIAFEVLASHNIKILASDVGGDKGRNLVFVSNTGEVYIKTHKKNLFDVMQSKAQ